MTGGSLARRVRSGALMVLTAAPALLAAHPAGAQAPLSALPTDVDRIARQARPSVVTVVAQRTAETGAGLVHTARPRRLTRVGSGVAVDDDLILTTASVVLGADRVLVRTANNLQVAAEVAGVDQVFNLALLRVPDLRLPPLRFALQRPPKIGDWVIALGTSYRAQPTQSVGNIAYRYREPRLSLLQITNTVYPGNSGGAALNTRGELVGIVQGELGAPELGAGDEGRRPTGISFVLPVETVAPVYRMLRRDGRVPHGFLGVTTRNASVTSETRPGDRIPIGAYVESVVAGGPAARAGLRSGDLVVAFDRERVEYAEQLARWVMATRPGVAVDLVWVRDNEQRSASVILGESPLDGPKWALRADPTATAPSAKEPRIRELERRILRLNVELQRLRVNGDTVSTP